MGITYKLTLAPMIGSEEANGHLQWISVHAQLTPLRTPARARFEKVEDFVAAFSGLMPGGQAEIALERLESGETVILPQPVPREALLSMKFDYI